MFYGRVLWVEGAKYKIKERKRVDDAAGRYEQKICKQIKILQFFSMIVNLFYFFLFFFSCYSHYKSFDIYKMNFIFLFMCKIVKYIPK